MITYVPGKHHPDVRPEDVQCPFGERDLQNDECYNGVNKCPFFIRYEWCNEHNACIACNHPPVPKAVQLELFND